jgi:PadR family transcriptional regulator, regulatory protein PadR
MPPFVPIGEFEQLVLIALIRLRERAYSVAIRHEIAERTGRDVSLGAVYKTLERLEIKGYVSTSVGDPTPERGGRRKKFFHIEPAGARVLDDSLRALQRMTAGLAWKWRQS